MEKPVEYFWKIRLEKVRKALTENNFDAYVADDPEKARSIVIDEILPAVGAKSVAWGGSMTVLAADLYAAFKKDRMDIEVIDTYDRSVPREEVIERRRRALLADLFLTGTNAVTEGGMLVNLDMYGNRVAAIAFGPRNVIIVAGRNKIVPNLEDAMMRIKNFAAPANAMRLDFKTPCSATSFCEDCKSPHRICNVWTITEKSLPKGRIKVILINKDLGL